MAQHEDSAAREVPWYRDLLNGSGVARGIDKDLRDVLVDVTRDRATSEALWARNGEDGAEQAPPSAPTVYDVQLNQRVVLRGADVRVTWEGLTPPSSRVTVIAPDGSEQIVNSGDSIAVRVTASGPITLRLNNQNRIMDVLAGHVECFELPAFRIPTGILPAVPRQVLPPVRIPSHVAAALRLPLPRLSPGSVAALQRQTQDSAPRAAGAAVQAMDAVRKALEAGRAPLDALRLALVSRPTRVTRP